MLEPRLRVWTPGGLKKSKESKSFSKEIHPASAGSALPNSVYSAHVVGGVAMRYLDCPKDSFPWKIRQLLEHGSIAIDPAVVQFWHKLIGESSPCFSREIERAAAILWMGLRGEGEGLPSMLATSFAEAAGVAGRQKWGLVLSSSARVSQVTYHNGWCEVPRVGHIQWNKLEFRQVEVASSLLFGMFHEQTLMLSRTLELLLTG